MLLFTLCLIGITGSYLLLALGALTIVRYHENGMPHVLPEALPCVSVLVAARNEETTLPDCLAALQQQHYPPDRIEFLIADDGSTDRTATLIRSQQQQDERFQYVNVPEAAPGGPSGKAHALHQAYRHASGNILLVTDADCSPPPHWSRHLASHLQLPERGVVCGITLVTHQNSVDGLQSLDWLLLLTVASAAATLGRPITAMGNNMAFRRETYEAVGGYPALAFSVTEDYAFIRTVHETTDWSVHLVLDPQIRNFTRPLPTLKDVFSQRRRWARGGLRARPTTYLLYLAVFLAHLLLLGGLFLLPAVAVPLLFLKMGAELALLKAGEHRLAWHAPLRYFPLFELYLFGYILLMPVALLFAPGITWKGRRF